MPDISLGTTAGGSQQLGGYLARPAGDGPWPGVVAIHEIFGVDDEFRGHCDRLAAAGYLTLGLDLFSDGGARRCIVATMRALFAGRGKPIVDIDAARTYLAGSAECTGKVGIAGFCMGGGFALLTAPRGFDVAAANYGQAPKHAGTVLADACPVVASYGGFDPLMIGQARKVEKALAANGIEHDLKVYPGAGHSFLNARMTGPRALHPIERVLNVGPRPAAAADAWRRIETFFATHLRG
ncbi:MAG: dienelactone hydrolase family protein [Jatrophihabitantaceae bacterium]